MKRHPSLRELSVEHHQGLVHARRLQKAGSSEALDLVQGEGHEVAWDFLRFFAEHANGHFREEEEVLLPAFSRYGDAADPAVVRMLVEHVLIRRLVGDLHRQLAAGQPSAETMHSTGALLQAHIRLEENVIFPLIEGSMPEDALAELALQLAEAPSEAAGH